MIYECRLITYFFGQFLALPPGKQSQSHPSLLLPNDFQPALP